MNSFLFYSQSSSSEVCIKRVIDATGIKYFQNNKQVERIEIKSFLQLFGFSKTYPFYCYLKHDEVDSVINMNKLELAMLVKRMAGLEDFLQSKKKSLQIVNETKEEIGKVTDYLAKIDAQLEIYEMEPSLLDYNHSLEKKQAIESRKHVLKNEEIEKLVESLQHKISAAGQVKERHLTEVANLDQNLKEIRRKQRLISPEIFKLQNEQVAIQKKRDGLASQQNEAKATIRSLDDQFQSQEHAEDYAEQELELVQASIDKKTRELNDLKAQKEELEREGTKLSNQSDELRAAFDEFFSRSQQNQRLGYVFLAKNERDNWMNTELKETVKKLGVESGRLKKFKQAIEKEQTGQDTLRNELDNCRSELVALGLPDDFETHYTQAFQRRNNLLKEQK